MTKNIDLPNSNLVPVTHPKYRADIDGLRAIAVLSVVGFHAFPNWFKGGFIGVDIFFVISGYLISTIIFTNLERDSFSFIEFYSRRIRRIFPALLIVLTASLVFGWFALFPDQYKQLGKHIAAGAGFISNFVLLNESGYFDNAAETKPLLHLWTLGIEEQFYILWPLVLWITYKKKWNLLTITIVACLISFVLNIKGIQTNPTTTFFAPQTRFWELLIGSVLAHITLHQPNLFFKFKINLSDWSGNPDVPEATETKIGKVNNAKSIFGAALIISSFLLITKEQQFPGAWALLPTLGAVLIISAGPKAWINRTILSSRIMVWVGLISFPLYLWHWPLLSFAHIIENGIPSRDIRIAVVLISIVLAWLTFRLIEKPIRLGKYTTEKTIVLMILMIVIGYLAFKTYKLDGITSRFPKMVQLVMNYKYDYHRSYREETCFLGPDQPFKTFELCETLFDKKKQTILLWGDSHAAHLYPGYAAVFSEKFNIVQRTASGCPPILEMEIDGRPFCRKNNDSIFESIKNDKPNKVVLSASWLTYDWKKVEETIIQLRKIGIENIDLIGPTPQWEDDLPKILYQYWKLDPAHKIPLRMNFRLKQNFIQLDLQMKDFSKSIGVNYISPKSILCDQAGCITIVTAPSIGLVAWDTGHLADMGSQYLVSNFPKN